MTPSRPAVVRQCRPLIKGREHTDTIPEDSFRGENVVINSRKSRRRHNGPSRHGDSFAWERDLAGLRSDLDLRGLHRSRLVRLRLHDHVGSLGDELQ